MSACIPKDQGYVHWRDSLATRLSWASVLVVATALVATGMGLIWIASRTQQESVFRLQEKSALRVAVLISGYVRGALDNLDLFERLVPLGAMSEGEQKTALDNLLNNRHLLFSQIVLMDRYGAEKVKVCRFHTFLPHELRRQAVCPALVRALSGRSYVSPVYVSSNSGLLSVKTALPVRAPEITHALMAEVNVSQLWQEVSRIRIGRTGYAYLVDVQGRFVAYQEPSTVLQRYGEDMRRIPPVAEFMASRSVEVGKVHEYKGLTGEPVIGLYALINGTDWAVIVELPMQEAFAGVRRMQWYLIGLTLLGTVVAGVAGFTVSRRIVRHIRALTITAGRMGQGDLDVEVIDLPLKDEVGVLAHTFRLMQDELRTLYKNLERQLVELRQTDRALREAHDKLEERVSERTSDLREANEELKKFAYFVSHDLRAPLINLKGFTAELRSTMNEIRPWIERCLSGLDVSRKERIDAAFREDIPEALSFIDTSVTRMDDLINAVLQLSRIGRCEMIFERIDMQTLVRHVIKSMGHQIEERGIRISVEELPQVDADRASMEQIMANLIDNAVKYLSANRKGEIRIWGEQDEAAATFHIMDNGRGIAGEDLPRVFELFRRVGSQDVPGYGMGLNYVQTLIRRHGGRIWCESELGAGTTFSFTIADNLMQDKGEEDA